MPGFGPGKEMGKLDERLRPTLLDRHHCIMMTVEAMVVGKLARSARNSGTFLLMHDAHVPSDSGYRADPALDNAGYPLRMPAYGAL